MKNEWPHLLADLRAKRDALTEAINVIEKNFVLPDDDDEPAAENVTRPRHSRGPAKAGRRSKKALKRNERTSKARANRDAPAEPP